MGRSFRRWSDSEVSYLLESGDAIEEVACRLGRTVKSCQGKLLSLKRGEEPRHINTREDDFRRDSKRRKRNNDPTRHRANENRAWKEDDLEVLLDMSKTVPEKASLLGRSLYAVDHKLRALGLANEPSKPWRESEVTFLYDETLTNDDIAKITGRTVQGVESKRCRLRKIDPAVPYVVGRDDSEEAVVILMDCSESSRGRRAGYGSLVSELRFVS